jgi:hypothetical protein
MAKRRLGFDADNQAVNISYRALEYVTIMRDFSSGFNVGWREAVRALRRRNNAKWILIPVDKKMKMR